jgi:hypothetical protein
LNRSVPLALLFAVLPRLAHALPDLTPSIYGVFLDADATVGSGDVAEGCAGATTGRTLLRFGVRSINVGATPLEMGDPGCPDCTTNPGAICGNPLFECSPADGHDHPHFSDFGRYELLDPAGNLVAGGGKRSFCMLDTACPGGGTRVYTDCEFQGISPGCYDEYAPTLGCQYIDVTDVPDVATRAFRLRVTLDADALLPDIDRTNNAAEFALPGCGDRIVQEDEDCDGGPCCDARCRFAAAGDACTDVTNACRPPGVCDGASAECVTGPPAADGTACGAGLPPCVQDVCRNGACVEEHVAGCVIDGACYAAGTRDPADACKTCDPSRRADAWSEAASGTPAGIGCQVGRIATATAGLACPARLMRRLGVRVERLDALATRLATAEATRAARLEARLARRAARLARVLAAAADHGRCATAAATAEVQRLRDELRTTAR